MKTLIPFILAYLLGGATIIVADRIQAGNVALMEGLASDRKSWEVAVAYLDAESLSNPDKRRRDEAYMMVKLARYGHELGFEDGQRLCLPSR